MYSKYKILLESNYINKQEFMYFYIKKINKFYKFPKNVYFLLNCFVCCLKFTFFFQLKLTEHC